MGTDVKNMISVPIMSQSNTSQPPSQSPSSSVHQQHSDLTPHPAQKVNSSSKKKKKSSNSTSTRPENVTESSSHSGSLGSGSVTTTSEPSLPNSLDQVDSNTTEQWRQRVQSLRTALNKAQKENQLLISDLAAAMARANDAENAEDAVNKGLLTARSVILQRDRTIAELKSTGANLRADLLQLKDEKKKTDKRLILLKTVSANLQEAREARNCSEKKLEDTNAEILALRQQMTGLGKDKDLLKQQVETMEMVKQQLARREVELDELSRDILQIRGKARHGEIRALAIGALSMLAVRVISHVVGKGRASEGEAVGFH